MNGDYHMENNINDTLTSMYTLDGLNVFFKGYPRSFISIVNIGSANLNICWLSTGLSFTIYRNTVDFEIYPNKECLYIQSKGYLYNHLEKGYKKLLNFFFKDLEEMPLYINDQNVPIKYIAKWRLKIGK